MDEDLVERILTVVELVPSGHVVSYGDIAGLVGTGPRLVGRVMSTRGAAVPWWRVVSASGRLPSDLLAQASVHWLAEDTPHTADGVRIRTCRADLVELATAFDEAATPA